MPLDQAVIILCLDMASYELERHYHHARLAQSAERKALNLVVVGSSPTVGVVFRHRLSIELPIQAGH